MKLYRYLTGKNDASFCQRVTEALNKGWFIYGSPTLAYNQDKSEMICGQVIIKEIEGRDYEPGMDLAKL